MKLDKKSSVIITATIIVVVLAIYVTSLPDDCGTYECFQKKMIECSPASYINEEPAASWKYLILGRLRDECRIEVTLLQAKEGELAIADFEGHKMECLYPVGVSAYPDKDLALCSGELKEDIQGRIIDKLHEYLLDNLIEIEEELRRAINQSNG